MSDTHLELLIPDLTDVPEDDKSDPRNAGVAHNVSEEEIEAQA